MFDKRLQEIKLQLNALALQNDLNYEEMIKYLNGFDLRPKKLHSFSSQIWNSQNSLESTRKIIKKPCTISSCFGKQNQENQVKSFSDIDNSSIAENQENMEYIHECLEDSLIEMNRVDNTIMENILEIVVTGKVYKIRQNFRELVLNMLSLSGFSFYVYYESGRIEFQDFSSNFITQILESDLKCKVLQKIVSSPEDPQMIEISNDNDYMKLFEIDPVKIQRGEFFGTTLHWISDGEEGLKICILMQTTRTSDVYEVKQFLSPKLLRKITEISMIETSENSASTVSKNYSKKMLDLLQIMINSCETRLKKKLCLFCDIKTDNAFSVSNLIRIAGNKFKDAFNVQKLNMTIKKLTDKFEETQYQLIEDIRMYKKFVSENCQILMEFNKNGKLVFCSSQKDNPIFHNLRAIWEPEKHILFTLFQHNPRLENHYKKALKGYKTQRFFEIARDIKTRIIQHKGKIEKIHVIFEEDDSSSTSFLGSKDSQTRRQRKYRNHNRHQCTTIKVLEEQHPGITDQGWLDLFVKDMKRNQRSHSGQKKKHQTFINQEKNILLMNKSFSSEVQLKDNLLGSFKGNEYEKMDLNLLNYYDEDLDNFALGLLNQLQYFQNLNPDSDKIQNFISDLHDLYEVNNNPFHNFNHGVNVMHTCFLISSLPENGEILNAKTIFSIVFSGLCHDVGHTGFTNDFQIASQSKKALIYNDRSPLQNFHASTTFQLLRKPENNFLEQLSPQDFKELRKKVIENILFTDIKEHFPLLKKFQETIKNKKMLTKEDSSLLSCMIVHSSDFGGSIKSFDVCKDWSFRVNKEFYRQYQQEGRLGLAQTPFMKDLDKLSVLSKGQCGFLKVIVFPLYQALKKLYLTNDMIHKFNRNIQNNIKEWQYMNFQETEKQKHQQTS